MRVPLLALLLCLPAIAAGQPEPASPGAPPTAVGWADRFAAARDRLLAGDFAAAADALEALADTAPGEADALRARELAALARHWAERGLVFVRRKDLGEDALNAKAVDQRTTDELVVLYIDAVLYGAFTGAWVDVLAEPGSVSAAIAPVLVFAGVGAGAVAWADAGRPLRYGVPQSIVAGMRIGLFEGLAWSLWNEARARDEDTLGTKGVVSVIWALTTAGAVAGGVIGQVFGTSPGKASMVESGALWTGAVAGLLVGAIADERIDDAALLAAAIGVNLGAIAGFFAASYYEPRVARVRFLDLGGIAGGLLAGGLYVLFADDDTEPGPLLGTTAAGIAAGIAAAWILTLDMPRDEFDRETATTGLLVSPLEGGAAVGLYGTF